MTAGRWIVEFIQTVIDLFLHIDEHLAEIIAQYGTGTYALLFAIIFMETGLVVTPFLPGDSLLFAAGTFASEALGSPLNVWVLFALLFTAAVLGDTVNYWIGNRYGLRLFNTNNALLNKVLKPEYLERTEKFYEKHGGKTIVLARFVPIVRTFAPFVAGIGSMTYRHFITFNVIGGFIWTALFIFAGYFFGNTEFVKRNFEFVIIAIIAISLVPMVIEYVRDRLQKRQAQQMTT
jgi:membrane-associated protein